ncbi:hypothetical protein OHC33_007214 [Knufia fluminis]|uniref:DMAP1-binding domain-containing protein n=1 Tax=Knufia fluminis TaxID=191047 RepID=A0AAN8I6I5_9EURO|nr:hypothetical protein OHC33_007214 [Knufia fluminis]
MASISPELEEELRELDQELEEGDITKKGYDKRRTAILSKYLAPAPQPAAGPGSLSTSERRTGLQIHQPDDSAHPAASRDDLRADSLSRLEGSGRRNTNGSIRSATMTGTGTGTPSSFNRQSTIYDEPQVQPPSHASRFIQQQVGGGGRHLSIASVDDRRNTISSISGDNSRTQTLMHQDYAFNPDQQQVYNAGPETRTSTMVGTEGYFSDFAGQQREVEEQDYGIGHTNRYSQSEVTSPTTQVPPPFLSSGELAGGAAVHLMPLEPRDVPFTICDPHDSNTEMTRFENIAMILRHRAKTTPKQAAYWVLDQKGKELVSITWEKLASRAEKVAQVIRDKSSLYRGDRVALIYTESEIIEFAVALLGCFIAGVVAVPINDLKNYQRLNVVLTSTQAHLALTTEANLKNFQRDITAAKQNWPRGVEWWKTNEFGSYHPKKKGEEPPLVVPDLAYIEFSTAPTGDLRGVVMSHKTIMHQMATLTAMITTATSNSRSDTFNPNLRDKNGHVVTGTRHGETILSYLDPRHSIGMIMGVLLNVYGGHTVYYIDQRSVETPGLYAHLITKYRGTLLVADYPGLKRAAINYQADPMTTRNYKKGMEPNFSAVKLCLIDTLTVDPEFHEVLADRWLRPLRNPRAREVVAPMLCLPEHGGMVISMRDWLGGEERMGCSLIHDMDRDKFEEEEKKEDGGNTSKPGFGSSLIGGGSKSSKKEKVVDDLGEVLLDKEALKTNDVVVLAMGSEAREKAASYPNAVRCGAFGYPIPDATLAVVDPESGLLCSPNSVGEIWVDSPSLSGGFWALPRHTEIIFHARPFCFKEGNPTPTALDMEFLRTGLLGCVIEGKVYVLGLYEDRLRQRVEWVEHGVAVQEHRYYFVQHLILSIMRNVPKIHDCSAFDCFVNDEHLPVVLLETASASTAPLTSGGPPQQPDIPLLDSLAERAMDILLQEHQLRVYCVMITAPGVLPRVVKNGRREIGNMLCRKEFDRGSLPCVHVKFGVERAVQNLAVGEDIEGGIWSPISSGIRDELLFEQEKQWSGADYREVVIDDRTSTSLSNFTNIFDLMQWRVARQADEHAYCTVDGRGKEGKPLTWKKFDIRVASVAMYLKNKVRLKPSDHIVLMYTHSEEYVFAVYACMVLGLIAIPIAPIDQNRLAEDAPAFLHIVADMNVKAVICNTEVNDLFKQKTVSQHLKQSAQFLKTQIPPVYNTTKPPKQSHGCRDLGLTINRSWISPTNPILIWTYWTPDQRRISVQLAHDTVLGMCKVQKQTFQMTSSKPVLGCVRSTIGIGFLHTCLMGVYNGCATYIMSPLDFAQNPAQLFMALSRYKVKDTYATTQMLDFAMGSMAGKGFSLHELRNLMISTEARPRQDIFAKVRQHFAQTGLDRTAINTVYSHVLNPMISSRSYMSIEPIELWLDTRALRRGLVYPVDPDSDPSAMCVQDSGMVPISTRVAIVNPETCALCHVGEYGEIWVQSEACAKSFYMSKQVFDEERFNGRLVGDNPNETYVRTGDLGFLHNVTRPIGANNQPVEMQILFVLGNIGETFEINGLNHFPIDIENSIERCHGNITPGGCAVFQAGGMSVVVIEVRQKSWLASMVPVIVNAVLSEHQIIVDIVAFVGPSDFPRSRLAEKQRGKILASWVTRKLRTIAQFGIRDPEGDATFMDQMSHRRSTMLGRASSQEPRSIAPSVEQSPAPASRNDTMSHRGSIMPEIPLNIPSSQPQPQQQPQAQNDYQPLSLQLQQNDYTIDTSGMFDRRSSANTHRTPSIADPHTAETPVVALNDRPYRLGSEPSNFYELPTEYHENNPYQGSDAKFFDPNADPTRPYGDYSPINSSEDLHAPENGRPRLSLANPDSYGGDDSPANSNTPTTATNTLTPTSAFPQGHGLLSQEQRDAFANESPYNDRGNPFVEHIPHGAGMPAFDIPSRTRQSYAPAADQGRTESPVTKARALLPSQMRNTMSASNSPVPLSPAYAMSNPGYDPSRHQIRRKPSPNPVEMRERLEQQENELRQQQGLAPNANGAGRDSDVQSAFGSVRRRYDGSGYGEWEY